MRSLKLQPSVISIHIKTITHRGHNNTGVEYLQGSTHSQYVLEYLDLMDNLAA